MKELRTKSNTELGELLVSTAQKIAEGVFYGRDSRSRNVKHIRELRRLRARVLTLLGEQKP